MKDPFLRMLARLVGSPTPYRNNRLLSAKIELAKKSARTRYASVRDFAPGVTHTKASQFARRGRIHGVFRHPRA